jgi:hypothetical protein
VVLLADGATGLVRAVSEPFDAVLVSAELPGLNGFRVCSRIKKDRALDGIRVFLMGSPQHLDAHQKLPTRADGYLQKPVRIQDLLPLLRLPKAGPSPAPASEGKKGRALSALREKLVSQEQRAAAAPKPVVPADPPTLQRKLDGAEQAVAALKTEIVVERSRSRAAEHLLREHRLELTEAERTVIAARAERDAANRRTEDLSKRVLATEASLDEALALLDERTQAEAEARAAAVLARLEVEHAMVAADTRAGDEARVRAAQVDELAGVRAELASARAELAGARAESDADLSSASASSERALERARAELELTVERERAIHAAEIAELEHRFQEATKSDEPLRAALARVGELEREANAARTQNEQLEEARSNAEWSEAAIRAELEQARAAARARETELHSAFEQQLARAVEAAEAQWKATLEERVRGAIAEHGQSLQAARSEQAGIVEELQTTHEAARKRDADRHATALAEVERRWTEEFERMTREVARALKMRDERIARTEARAEEFRKSNEALEQKLAEVGGELADATEAAAGAEQHAREAAARSESTRLDGAQGEVRASGGSGAQGEVRASGGSGAQGEVRASGGSGAQEGVRAAGGAQGELRQQLARAREELELRWQRLREIEAALVEERERRRDEAVARERLSQERAVAVAEREAVVVAHAEAIDALGRAHAETVERERREAGEREAKKVAELERKIDEARVALEEAQARSKVQEAAAAEVLAREMAERDAALAAERDAQARAIAELASGAEAAKTKALEALLAEERARHARDLSALEQSRAEHLANERTRTSKVERELEELRSVLAEGLATRDTTIAGLQRELTEKVAQQAIELEQAQALATQRARAELEARQARALADAEARHALALEELRTTLASETERAKAAENASLEGGSAAEALRLELDRVRRDADAALRASAMRESHLAGDLARLKNDTQRLLGNLRVELERQRETARDLEQRLRSAEQEAYRLAHEKTQAASSDRENAELRGKLERGEALIADANRHVEELRAQLAARSAANTSLEQTIAELREKLAAAAATAATEVAAPPAPRPETKALADAREQLREMTRRLAAAESQRNEVPALEAETKHRDEVARLRKQHEAEAGALRDEIQAAARAHGLALADAVTALENERASKKREITEAVRKASIVLRTELETANAAETEWAVAHAQSEVRAELAERHETWTRAMADSRREHETARSALETRVTELTNELSTLRVRLTEERNASGAASDNQSLRQEITQLEVEISGLRRALAAANEQLNRRS